MSTYEIINDITKEVVDTSDNYRDAVGIAAHLSESTRVLHFVPVGVERELEFAV